MTEIVSGSASITDLYNRIGYYKGSPVRIAQATYDFLDEVLNNQIDLVDPTNPFILGLEMSSLHTALAVNESLLNLRRSYAGLAQTDQDIYRHMTDAEYIGRFATPGSVPFTFMFDLNSLLNALVEDTTENCMKAIIPRDTFITIDTYTFTLEYPIVIRQFPNGVMQITHDTSISSPISTPSNNIISFKTRQDSNGIKWLYFVAPVKEMTIVTSNYAFQQQKVFNFNIPFTSQFLFARVFQKSNTTGADWVEMVTTHSDQVFDQTTPTAVLMVTSLNLNVTIPYIYNTLGTVSGTIRIDLYTTDGNIDVNMGGYTLDQFAIKFRAIDSIRDTNVYTNIWSTVNYLTFSDQILSGGSDGIAFTTLKNKVINYAFGGFNIPITTAQLDTVGELNGFTIVRNADTLTDRYMLGIRPIPNISIANTSSTSTTSTGVVTSNNQKLLSRANVGMIRFSSEISDLQTSDNVVNNSNRFTLLSNTAFSLNNGIASLVESSVISSIKSQPVNSLVSTVNAASYVYTPYYYVFDLQDSLLDVRPYDLDHPDIANLNFILQNNTLALVVNTGSYTITKTSTGYTLTIVTISGSAYKQLNDNQVGVQLRLVNEDGSLSGTINGVQQGVDSTSNERIYTFDIQTTYDIDGNNCIEIINVYNSDGLISNFYVALDRVVDILYTTTSVTSGFVSDETDTLVNKAQLPIGSVGNTHDQLEVTFGSYLEHLWARVRSYATGADYQTSPSDVPQLYTKDIYQINPITNSMLFIDGSGNPYYNKIHSIGDPVLDGSANPVYTYRAGDNILDNNGNPIIISEIGAKNDFDILVIDANLLFTTDPNYVSYRDQVVKTMTEWITVDILEVQARLIERTEIFFYPQASLGVTQIIVNNNQNVYIDSEQSLTITVFIDQSVVNDTGVQNTNTNIISDYLDNNITQLKFTINQMESDLKTALGNNVYGVTIRNLGGTSDYKSMTITDQHNRLCIARKLIANQDNTVTIQPDLNIIYTGF